jgi:hypothetical protein
MLIRFILVVTLFLSGEDGTGIDPHGLISPRTGSCIDPLGGCASSSVVAPPTGSCIDPQGTPCADSGGAMDPNG